MNDVPEREYGLLVNSAPPGERPVSKQMRRIEERGAIRFLTFSCQNRQPLLADGHVCSSLLDAVDAAREMHGLLMYAWVIMPEHVHLLASPRPGQTMETSLRSIKMSVARRALALWKQQSSPILDSIRDGKGLPRFWLAGGGFDRSVRDVEELSKEVRYIHRNPVERGLVTRAEDWRWSSVRWWQGTREGEFECDALPGHWRGWEGFV